MKAVPINLAEAVIEPFWNNALYDLSSLDFLSEEETGLVVKGNWCNLTFNWAKGQLLKPVFTMKKCYPEPVSIPQYDTLLLSVMAPDNGVVVFSASTDAGFYSMKSLPFVGFKRELSLPIQGNLLLEFSMELYVDSVQPSMGWLNWFGAASSERLPLMLGEYTHYDAAWEGVLHPRDTPVSFRPRYGIFFGEEELLRMRAEYEKGRAAGAESPFSGGAYENFLHPEACIKEFVNFWNDTRYCRERDQGKELTRHGVAAALGGVLEKNQELLRLAARYAMSILMCKHWDDGMICRYPIGGWEHRCFVQSICLYDLAFIYDLAWEYFTKPATELLFRRMVEEGLSSIQYSVFKHEYIFSMNQLVWFSNGRMAAYSLLGKEFPRTKPYMELAFADVLENMEKTVLADGGYVEGPTYFSCIGNNGGQALALYARAIGVPVSQLLPERLRETVHFADALASTDEEVDMIPICDARAVLPHSHLAFFADALNESRWVEIYQKSVRNSGGLPDHYYGLLVSGNLQASKEKAPPLTFLTEMKLIASERSLNGEPVKLLLLGNRAGAGHTHEDKGSFVLEFAGETFACDLGTCDYSSPHADLYKHCQRHNMLVPVGKGARVAPENPCMTDIMPEGIGDENQCRLSVAAGSAFPKQYEKWVRTITSDSPAHFQIHDEYALKPDSGCMGVAFYWNTKLAVRAEGERVFITGKRRKMELRFPTGMPLTLEELPLAGGKTQTRIALFSADMRGQIDVEVKLL